MTKFLAFPCLILFFIVQHGSRMMSVTRHENWSEHQTTMFSSLHEKQKQGKFCDVILKCSDSAQTFNAHSCVLSAASTGLDKILNDAMENAVAGTSKLEVTLPDDVASSCMDSLLNFIYSGNIDLNSKKPNAQSAGSGTPTRKSKRNSSKMKSSRGNNVDASSPDIPLLYAFLKASRRLEIHTLTEHLESAVTLSEMKMSDSRDASATEESSVTKNDPSSRPTGADENHDCTANHNTKAKADTDQNKSTTEKTKSATRRKSGRLMEKAATETTSVTRVDEKEHNNDGEIGPETSSNKLIDALDGKDKDVDSKSGTVTIRISGAVTEEVDKVVTTPSKARVVKKLQCPTCQDVFKSADTYESHMKNHLNEIEIALSKNKQKSPSFTDTVNGSAADHKSGNNEVSVNKHESNRRTSERPKRASTAKFHEMMKSTFGAEHSIAISPKKTPAPSISDNEDDSDMCAIILTQIDDDQPVINTMVEEEDSVQEITLEESAVEEEVVVVESDRSTGTWHPVDNEITLTTIDRDATGEEIMEGTADILSFVTVEDDINTSLATTKSKPKGKIKKEQTSQSDDNSQICSECGKAVPNMKAHLRIHARSLPCHVCGDTFKYRSALNRHMQFHSEGLSCSTCGERIFSQRDMTKHMAKHNQKKMRTECPDCKKSFTSEYVMQLHRRTHTGEEKFACNVCSKRFPYKSSLKMHMLLHTGEKPYICSICGKCFVQKIHAKEHEMQHQGIKRQFQCPICQKNFAHKCGLTRHIADIHNKSRPFVCDTCGKSFPRKTKLIEHKRMHTGEKPYICELCGMRYKANRSLKCHKKTEHGVFVADYQVGIWRKGPMPPVPENERRKAAAKRKSKPITVAKDVNGNKNLLSFPFPVSSEDLDMSDGEEDIMTDISEHVAIVAGGEHANQTFSADDGKAAQHFSYPIPQADQNFHGQFTTLAEVSSYAPQPLPPASTLTKSDPANPLEYPFSAHKTFIVPLTSSTHPSVPVVVDPNPSQIDQSQVPGMMVTYMMPPQSYTITEATTVNTVVTTEQLATQLPDASRSASVPPMSTFSRSSNVTATLKPNSPVQVLPGMHTFQPGVQFRVTSTDMNTKMIEIAGQAEIPVIAEGQHILPVSPSEDVPPLAEEVTVQQHHEEWTDEYSS